MAWPTVALAVCLQRPVKVCSEFFKNNIVFTGVAESEKALMD